MKRNRPPAPKPAAKPPEPRPALPEGHSGEGSASALETLQKMEKRRVDARPSDPAKDEDR